MESAGPCPHCKAQKSNLHDHVKRCKQNPANAKLLLRETSEIISPSDPVPVRLPTPRKTSPKTSAGNGKPPIFPMAQRIREKAAEAHCEQCGFRDLTRAIDRELVT